MKPPTRDQMLALAELRHKAGRYGAWAPVDKTARSDRTALALDQAGLAVIFASRADVLMTVTSAGLDLLTERNLISADAAGIRERLGFPAGYGVARYRTAWLNVGGAA